MNEMFLVRLQTCNTFIICTTNNFILLNSDKKEILLIGPKDSTQNILDHNLQLDGCTVTSSTVTHLGVILDSNLSFENHISNVTKTAFFHLSVTVCLPLPCVSLPLFGFPVII